MPNRIKGIIKKDKYSRQKSSVPSLEKFIEKRDYVGASTFLNFSSSDEVERLLWKGYCSFHNNEFETAQEMYISLLSGDYSALIPEKATLYLACVYHSMQMYSEASEAASDGPECSLKHRIMYHLSHRLDGNPETVLMHRQSLSESEEDKLCHAAMLYEQCDFQGACEIYKHVLAGDRTNLALNVFIAMCYHKMVSLAMCNH